MQCDYFDAGTCRSCAWLPTPYAVQLRALQDHVAGLLPGVEHWEAVVAGPDEGFRTKAKMVVGGTVAAPTLGILDEHRRGIDLRGCGLHDPALHDALPALAAFVTAAGLTPYDVPARRGELKHLLVTVSPDRELMVRFVLRTTEALPRLRKHLPGLREALPGLRVVTANLQPRHAAVLEGEHEEVLLGETLPLRLDVTLHLGPRSFVQTNTEVARLLYRTAADWAEPLLAGDLAAAVWDLYCGVGGFALHLAQRAGVAVTGVEVSPEAAASADRAAREQGLDARFLAGDAVTWARARAADGERPHLVVVNPPRRGLGADLCATLEEVAAPWVLYSSCHAGSLARDLAALPSYAARRGQVFDMFPHTEHAEVLVLLERAGPDRGEK